MTLRWRLFATYFLLLVVTLAIIVGAMIVFFSTRPEPPQNMYRQLLSDAARMVGDLRPFTLAGELARTIEARAEEYVVRVLRINNLYGTVQYDSSEVIPLGTPLMINIDTNYRPSVERNRPVQLNDGFFGNFRDPTDQTEWLFIGIRAAGTTILISEARSTRTLNDALAEFGNSLAAPLIQSAIVGLLFAFVLAAVISRQIAKPLGNVAEAAHTIAQGDYNVTLSEDGTPEIRAVAEAFNTMTREVQSTQQAQRDFLANVSHDLKTPLTSIQGYSQAIIDGAVRDPAVAADVIYSEADRLTRMVSELTDLARLQAGHVALHLDRVNVTELTQALVQRIDVVAKKRDIALTVDSPGHVIVTADGDRLAQVITNLLSNAVKFTPEGGHITVALRSLDNGVELSVSDSGIGIPEPELSRVFERFYQVDKARGPRRGAGLGLAIAKEIVGAHGGRIGAESMGEGGGTTFVVWLPSQPPANTVVSRGEDAGRSNRI